MNVRHKLAAVVLLLLVSGLAVCLPAVARAIEQPTLTLTAELRRPWWQANPVTLAASLPGVSGATLTVTRQRAGATGFIDYRLGCDGRRRRGELDGHATGVDDLPRRVRR